MGDGQQSPAIVGYRLPVRPDDYDASEPTAAMRPIPIEEGEEPLVDFSAPPYALPLERMRFDYRRELYGRRGLVERLKRAHEQLGAEGYGLLILECWRPPFIQRRMFLAAEAQLRERMPDLSSEELRTMTERYSAPMDDEVPPPHTTGGAVDLWLSGPDGRPADLHSPYDWMDHEGFAFDAPALSPEARAHRDRLGAALNAEGLTNYTSEYWHWSWGDQGWAYRGGERAAIYGAIAPEDFVPNPADDIEGPLVFVPEDPLES